MTTSQDLFVSVLGFGLGEHGQLGTLSKTTQGTPTLIDHSNASFVISPVSAFRLKSVNEKINPSIDTIDNTEIISEVAAGGSHGAFITTHGSIYTWGGGPKLHSIPRQVVLLRGKKITHIACGALHAVAIESSRHVHQWGIVGNAISEDESTFTTPQYLNSFEHAVQKIVCGARHALVISNSRLYSFGSNKEGQLGTGDNIDNAIPHIVAIGNNEDAITDVAAGGEHSLCVSGSRVFSWGSSKYGQLGHGNSESAVLPTLVKNEEMKKFEIQSVCAGDYQSYAISTEGKLFSWGRGNCGQLGHGDTENRHSPKLVEYFENAKEKVVEVGSGGGFQVGHAIARCESSHVYSWGSNRYYQLGVLKSQENELVPTLVDLPPGTTVHHITCGWLHTLLLVLLPFKPQKTPSQQQHSLGSFVRLPNEIIMEVLKFVLDPKALAKLCQASSSFRDLLRNENLWQAAYMETYGETGITGEISWRNRCKSKCIETVQNKYGFGNELELSPQNNNNNSSGGIFQKISKIWNKKSFQVLMVVCTQYLWITRKGLDAAGKTSIIYYYFKKEPETTIPTIGFVLESFTHNDTSFYVWDFGGQRMRPLYRHFMQNSKALVFVVDSNDRDRFEEVHDEFWKAVELMREPEFDIRILLILANKQDLPFAVGVTESTDFDILIDIAVARMMELEKLTTMRWFIQPCSMPDPKAVKGIKEGFAWLSHALDHL